MSKNVSLYSVKALIILDNEGERLFAKYYNRPQDPAFIQDEQFATLKNQKTYEKSLFQKTNKQNADITLFQNHIVVYKQIADLLVYLIGGLDDNELILSSALDGFTKALDQVLAGKVDKRSLQESYDKLSIVADETIDDGIILETEPTIIQSRTSNTPVNVPTLKNLELNEKGLLSAWKFAKSKLSESFQQDF